MMREQPCGGCYAGDMYYNDVTHCWSCPDCGYVKKFRQDVVVVDEPPRRILKIPNGFSLRDDR